MPEVKKRNGMFGKIPAGGKFVGRPTKWGNPYHVEEYGREEAIRLYREGLVAGGFRVTVEDARRELRGLDLYCWCAPEPCHGDVLLRLANE